jgi:HSP20 family protein
MASRFLTTLPLARGWMPEPLFQLQREIDRVFEDVFSATAGGAGAGRGSSTTMMSAPRIDLQDSDGELRLHADLPGVAPADLDIRVDGDVLTIRGERKSESERNEHNYHVMERSHGRFQRSIQLPFEPDPQQVEATVREGVLEVRIPKRAPQERSRRIEVRDAGAQGRSIGTSSSGAGSGGGSGIVGASGSGGSRVSGSSAEHGSSSLSSSNFGGSGSSSSGSTQPGSGSTSGGAGSSGSGDGARSGGGVSSGGAATGQGPGGSSSVTPGSDGGSAAGGLAGAVGGPTAVPSGQETSTSR